MAMTIQDRADEIAADFEFLDDLFLCLSLMFWHKLEYNFVCIVFSSKHR